MTITKTEQMENLKFEVVVKEKDLDCSSSLLFYLILAEHIRELHLNSSSFIQTSE